jgi:hypothetical protein
MLHSLFLDDNFYFLDEYENFDFRKLSGLGLRAIVRFGNQKNVYFIFMIYFLSILITVVLDGLLNSDCDRFTIGREIMNQYNWNLAFIYRCLVGFNLNTCILYRVW